MTDTDQTDGRPATTARCLWCSAERPIDVDVCPACEHSWIDATIDEARAGKLDRLGTTTGGGAAPEQPTGRRRWFLVALLFAVVAVYGAILFVDSSNTQPAPTVTATTQATVATTTATTAPTTVAPTTATPTTTTTTSTTTTTTTTLPPIAIVEPAYAVSDLTLGAFALGPVSFGSTDPDFLGRIVATFGQPDAIYPPEEAGGYGLCPDETGRVIEFGYLNLVFRDDADGETFVGYRLRDQGYAPDHPTGDLETISGLGLGDTLSRVQQLYSRVATTELTEPDDETLRAGSEIFIVQRSSDGRTLIWGSFFEDLDSEDEASEQQIRSIHSPNSCDRGPTP